MAEQGATPEFDIHRVLRVLRRRKLVILVLTVVVPLATLAYSLRQPTEYTATSTLLLQNPQLPQQLTSSLTLGGEDPTRVQATAVKLVELGTVANATAHTLHRPIGTISVSGDASTDLVSISATSTTPRFAALVANTYARQYQAVRRKQEAATILKVRDQFASEYAQIPPAERTTTQAKTLLTTSNRLTQLAALQTGDAQLVQSATKPTAPSGPQTVRNVILGLAVGLMLGLALAFLIDIIDRRVREPSELEEIFERPVLATVPEMRELKADREEGSEPIPGHAIEAFQLLRANLRYFNVEREMKVVLVTSALSGEGKTTVAWHLARAAARARARVLLIEADLRRPALAGRLGLPSVGGLSTLLSGGKGAVERVPVQRRGIAGPDGVAKVDVLFAGPKPPNPTDLLESSRMARLLEDAKVRYDLIVIDTPPASMVSDAAPLVRLVDGVIVVSRLRKVKRESAMHLHKQLERLHAPTIGLVVNSLRKADAYGYGSYENVYSGDARKYLAHTAEHSTEQDTLASTGNGRASSESVHDAVGVEEDGGG